MTAEELLKESWEAILGNIVRADVTVNGKISRETIIMSGFDNDKPSNYEIENVSDVSIFFNDVITANFENILKNGFTDFSSNLKAFILNPMASKIEKSLLIKDYIRLLEEQKADIFEEHQPPNLVYKRIINKIPTDVISIRSFIGSKLWVNTNNEIEKMVNLQIAYIDKIKYLLNDTNESIVHLPESTIFTNTNKLSFSIRKTELGLLFLALRGCGIISKFTSDSQLATFLESYTECDNNKEVKGMKVLISQIRGGEKGTGSFTKVKQKLDSITLPVKED